MEKKMENEMETGVIKGLYGEVLLTLGRKVLKYYLHWTIWIPRVRVLGLVMEKKTETIIVGYIGPRYINPDSIHLFMFFSMYSPFERACPRITPSWDPL